MKRIYVVEDHAIVRDGLRAMLEAGGYQVVGEAVDATTALADVGRLAPDLLLLDLGLDDSSGLTVLAELQRCAPSLRVLVLTMSMQPRNIAEAMRLGAAGYLLKDASRAELLRAIEGVSRGEPQFAPEIAALAAQLPGTPGDNELLEQLSPRERQIISMVVGGASSQAIGEQLGLSAKTVDTYRSRLMVKLGVPDVIGMVRFAIRVGLIDAQRS